MFDQWSIDGVWPPGLVAVLICAVALIPVAVVSTMVVLATLVSLFAAAERRDRAHLVLCLLIDALKAFTRCRLKKR